MTVRTTILTFLVMLIAATISAETVLKAGDGIQWYKGNTHTHTLWSDGDGAPEIAVEWYKRNGYNFLTLSEHNVVAVGEKWAMVGDDLKLKQAQIDMLKEQYGEEWVEMKEKSGKPWMRLKTFAELTEHFCEPGSFILVMGEEVTCLQHPVHMNAINITDVIRPAMKGDKTKMLADNLAAVRKQEEATGKSILAHLNHPNFDTGVTAQQMMDAGGLEFFEVYNGHGSVNNWGNAKKHMPTTDRLWDIMLAHRIGVRNEGVVYGVASDDAHNYFKRGAGSSIPGRGWCMVLTEELSSDALVAAMKDAHFYATSGVELEEIVYGDDGYTVAVKAEPGATYTVQFIGTREGFDEKTEPLKDEDGNVIADFNPRYSESIGEVLLETTDSPATYTYKGDELYVRAKVISDVPQPDPFKAGDVKLAWTQPVALK